ncbi:MAG: response regulator [Cyclobacteriaceae bacterium]
MGKILVAEDSIIVNQHIRRALESGNHDVISAFSGAEAVSSANRDAPDLILMDIMMESSSDGIDAAMEIKETIDIPIIFLTALTDEPTLKKAKISQPYGYVVKPFNEAELLSNIDVALYKAEAEREIKENSELFQVIINSIDHAIILVNAANKIKYTNLVAEQCLNKSFDNLVNNHIDQFLAMKIGNYFEPVSKILDEITEIPVEFEIEGSDLIFGDCEIKEVFIKEPCKFLFFKDISDRVKHRRIQEESKTRRVSLLIEGQENERERIARDLHDGVGQLANVVKMTAKKLEVGPELTDSIDLFLDEMRKVTEGLLPLRLNDFPLDVCLNSLVEQVDKSSPISFSFSSSDLPEVSMNNKINLYRVTQEALSNILKHSNAKNAYVQVHGFDDHLQLTIEDDGKGFDKSYKDDTSHHGLQNILFRSEVMKGTCDVESSEGKGTFISLVIPNHQ